MKKRKVRGTIINRQELRVIKHLEQKRRMRIISDEENILLHAVFRLSLMILRSEMLMGRFIREWRKSG